MPLKIKNWKKLQHYKNRCPPWIKLYRDLLEDPEWHELSPVAAKALVSLWLVASENGGELPDIRRLAFRLRLPVEKTEQVLSSLGNWIVSDDPDTLLSSCYRGAIPDKETEKEKEKEKETEENTCGGLEVVSEVVAERKPEEGEQEKEKATPPWKLVSFTGTEIVGITAEMIARWKIAYPAVDIAASIAAASEWLVANPTKTKRNVYRFLTNWLSRNQERGGGNSTTFRQSSWDIARQIPPVSPVPALPPGKYDHVKVIELKNGF